jgi:hypothetical protein
MMSTYLLYAVFYTPPVSILRTIVFNFETACLFGTYEAKPGPGIAFHRAYPLQYAV